MHLRHKSCIKKRITREQWDLNHLASIAPPVHLCQQRQVGGDTFFLQFCGYSLFMSGTGLNCIPVRLFNGFISYRVNVTSQSLSCATHGFTFESIPVESFECYALVSLFEKYRCYSQLRPLSPICGSFPNDRPEDSMKT